MDYNKIKMLVLDVDGVLSDGTIIISSEGSESKNFNVKDGHRIKLWLRSGFDAAVISGRDSNATTLRCEQLGIKYVYQGCKYKEPVFDKLLGEAGILADEVAYVGDDLMDVPLVRKCGFGVAVADASRHLKKYCDYVTKQPGGKGAVCEVIEYLLIKNGKWQEVTKRYFE
jgi:3-deoxy-D-manno-octulosonate 8-phosphate phosphatase (KDO 8-P phosphatase)